MNAHLPITEDPVLARLREELRAMYGDRLARIVLFGSRASGSAGVESDYDIAVFLNAMTDRWAEFDRLAQLRVRLLDDVGIFIDAFPFTEAAAQERTPLMHEIRRTGIDL